MSESKFTPGPWKVAGQGLDNEIEIVTTKLRGETVCVVLNDAEDVAVWPDAYLIAASPELHGALNALTLSAAELLRVIDDLRERGDFCHWQSIRCDDLAADVSAARAALLKATPEQSS